MNNLSTLHRTRPGRQAVLCLTVILAPFASSAADPRIRQKPVVSEGGKGIPKNEVFSLTVAPWTAENPRHDGRTWENIKNRENFDSAYPNVFSKTARRS